MDVDISATLLNDLRVSKQLGSTRLETADVLLTHILMRLPIESRKGYCAYFGEACNHSGTPLAALLKDYDTRLRKEALYKVTSQVIANLVDLEGDVQESVHVCSDLLFAFFLPPDNHTVFHDDRVMMVIMIVADLVFKVVQAERNEQLALLLHTCGRRVLSPVKSETSFIVDHWLFTGWLHEYDKLIDPQRVCDLIADPVMLTIKQIPQIPASPHSLLEFDNIQGTYFSYLPRGTFFVNDPAPDYTKMKDMTFSIQSGAFSTNQPDAPSTSQPDASSTSKPDTPSPSHTFEVPTATSSPDVPSTSRSDTPSTSWSDAPSTSQPDAPSTNHSYEVPSVVTQKLIDQNVPEELKAFSSQSYSQSFSSHYSPKEGQQKVIIPTTHCVLYSYVYTRIKDELDMACLSKFFKTPLHHKDHVTLSIASTLNTYGQQISQMKTYLRLFKHFLNTLTETADAERKNKYKALSEQYVMAAFQPIYYDQIMVICHLTSDLVNHYLQNDDLQMAFNCFSWGYIALRVPAKKDEVVNHGWTKLGLSFTRDQVINRQHFNILRDDSLIGGKGPTNDEEVKKESMSMSLNQTSPFIEDPTTSPPMIMETRGNNLLTGCILYIYIFRYRGISFGSSLEGLNKLDDRVKDKLLPAYNRVAEVMVVYGKRIATTNVYRNSLIYKLTQRSNNTFRKLGDSFKAILHEIMTSDECVLYDRIMTVALLTADMVEKWQKNQPGRFKYSTILYKAAVDVLEEPWCRQVVRSGWGRLPSLKDKLMNKLFYDVCTDAVIRSELPKHLPKIYQCAPFLETTISRTSKMAGVNEAFLDKV